MKIEQLPRAQAGKETRFWKDSEKIMRLETSMLDTEMYLYSRIHLEGKPTQDPAVEMVSTWIEELFGRDGIFPEWKYKLEWSFTLMVCV